MDIKIRANKIEELDEETICNLIMEFRNKVIPRFNKLDKLYKGGHDIEKRKGKPNKPNNKLIADFPGKIIDTEVGYFLGKPVVFNMEEDDTREALDDILNENEFDDMLMEVGKEAGIKGISSIMLYQDEEGKTNICRVPADNVIFLKRHLGENVGVAIRMYTEYLANGDEITHIEVYDDTKIRYYKMNGDSLGIDDTAEEFEVGHIYGVVPIIPVLNNEEEQGSFEKVISLIDAYDKLDSDTSNEHEAYRNAYLILKNLSADEDTMASLSQSGILEVYDDGDASFLAKPILDGAINSHLDRLSMDIHKFADVPDLSDENFAGNLSGVAIRFKLFGLETKCIIKERKLTRALRIMLKALSNVLEVNSLELNPNKVKIIFTRNIPANITEIVDTVVKLKDVVDNETLLSQLPFIDNPQEVTEKLKAQKDAEKDSYLNDMNNYSDKTFNSVNGKSPASEEPQGNPVNDIQE